MNPLVNILVILVLFFFNAIFAMYEIAMVSARKTRLQQRSEDGNSGASDALFLLDDPNSQYLSTVQIMITLIDTLAGGIGGAMLARPLAAWLHELGWNAPYVDTVALVVVVIIITYFSIVLGELIPKRLAVSKPENVVSQLSPAIRVLTKIFRPLTKLLSTSTNIGLKLFRINTDEEPSITEDEIKVFIEQGREIGVIEDAEKDMVSGVFRLGDRRVESLMTPRTELVWIDIEDAPEVIVKKLIDSPYSRIPVGKGDLDEVLGVIYIKDLLGIDIQSPGFDLESHIKPAIFFPENTAALQALEIFRNSGVHNALVIDEYGGTQGMVTLYDVLEAIVGDIAQDSEDTEQDAIQRSDGSWLFDGLIGIDELKEILEISNLPEEDKAGYRTLSGFIMYQLGSIPKSGQVFDWGNLRFEVVDMDGRRVDKVLVSLKEQQ